MPIPSKLAQKYLTVDQLMAKRGVLIGTEGPSDSGKSEFWLSAPGPIAAICIDRMIDGTLRNEAPPPTRRSTKEVYINIIKVPLAGTGPAFLGVDRGDKKNQDFYKEYWEKYRDDLYEILEEPYFKTIVLDGDSDSWQLQRLAAFGKLDKIMPINYTDVNNARKALIAKCWDSGKIVIATNKVKDDYVDKVDQNGVPEKDNQGNVKQVKSGEQINQGFHDIEYLWHIRLRHLYQKGESTTIQAGPRKGQVITTPPTWGAEVIKCKPRKMIEGMRLFNGDCSFSGVVRAAFPTIPLKYWGL